MTREFRIALSLSIGVHALALVGLPMLEPVEFDVERGPASMEFQLVSRPSAPSTPRYEVGTVSADPLPVPEKPHTPPQPQVTVAEQGARLNAVMLPAYLRNPPPVYPRAARAQGHEGTVLLDVEVLDSGRCGTVTVLTSSGYEALDEAAVAAVRDWVFKPARRLRRPVAFWVEIPITFRLTDEHKRSGR